MESVSVLADALSCLSFINNLFEIISYNDRYNKLVELGFVFSVHAGSISPRENAYTWINGINHLIEYTKIYHDANVHRDYKSPDGYRLGSWVKTYGIILTIPYLFHQ